MPTKKKPGYPDSCQKTTGIYTMCVGDLSQDSVESQTRSCQLLLFGFLPKKKQLLFHTFCVGYLSQDSF